MEDRFMTQSPLAPSFTRPFFDGDRYDTPADNKRDLMDRLCFGGSFWFYCLHSRAILHARSQALSNNYGDDIWAQTSFDIFRILERCGARFHISGLDHLRTAQGPLVFISNHMSTTETQVFPCIIAPFKQVTFIVKSSLTTMPIFGPIMRSRDPICVNRENAREDMVTVMTDGVRKLEEGISVIVFPEATRQTVFKPEKFNSLGVKLAKRAGVQAMPVAIKTDFWKPGKLIKDFGPLDRSQDVHIEFGAPMDIEGNGKDQHREMVEFIGGRLKSWGGDVQ